MNTRIKKKRLKNCGFVKHRKDLKWKLKHGYKFPWVSEQGPCPIPLCMPGDCIICRFCSDVFLDWNGPYAVVCRFGRHAGNCKSFMLDEDQPLFHPEDRKNIDAYIASVRGYDKEPPDSMSIEKAEWPRIASMFKDLFSNICPMPNITPEEIDSIEKINSIQEPFGDESIFEYLDRCYNDTTQDHYGNKADIIDIDEFTTEEGNET